MIFKLFYILYSYIYLACAAVTLNTQGKCAACDNKYWESSCKTCPSTFAEKNTASKCGLCPESDRSLFWAPGQCLGELNSSYLMIIFYSCLCLKTLTVTKLLLPWTNMNAMPVQKKDGLEVLASVYIINFISLPEL